MISRITLWRSHTLGTQLMGSGTGQVTGDSETRSLAFQNQVFLEGAVQGISMLLDQ